MTLQENNKAIVRKFFDEACNNQDDKIIDEIFSSNVRFNGKAGSPGEVRKFLKDLRCAFEDLQVQVHEQIAEENQVFTLRTWTGRQVREYDGSIHPANKFLNRTEASVVTIENDKIVEDWVVRSEFTESLKPWLYYVKPNEFLPMWQFYQHRADQIKDRLWTSAALHFTFLAVTLGFVADKCLNFSSDLDQWITNAPLLSILSAMGVLVSLFTAKFIKNYGKHINSNWDRADDLKWRIVDLHYRGYKKDDQTRRRGLFDKLNGKLKIPFGDARYLYWIGVGFSLLYLILSGLGIYSWSKL